MCERFQFHSPSSHGTFIEGFDFGKYVFSPLYLCNFSLFYISTQLVLFFLKGRLYCLRLGQISPV